MGSKHTAINDVDDPPLADPKVLGPDPAGAREQLARILAHPLFQNSKRFNSLLRYVVERTLEGKHDSLKERIIGIEVFGRAVDYEPGIDAVARVAVTELRKRLTQYYSEPGHERELRIELPIRSYVAEFKLPAQIAPAPEPLASAVPGTRPSLWSRINPIHRIARRPYLAALAAAVTIAFAIWAGLQISRDTSALDRFWAPIKTKSSIVLLCVGQPISVDETPTSMWAQHIENFVPDQHVSVGMIQVHAAEDLAGYLRRSGTESMIRPTPVAHLEDLHSQPLVLYGIFLNDWQMRLDTDIRFRFRTDPTPGWMWIEDKSKPGDRSWSHNLGDPTQVIDTDYALISRVRDRTTGRWWIGIAGLTDLGTAAAGQFVLNPKSIPALSDTLPAGWDRKNIQVLLAVKLVQGSPADTRVVSSYSW